MNQKPAAHPNDKRQRTRSKYPQASPYCVFLCSILGLLVCEDLVDKRVLGLR